ncbi:MAG: rhodanese-related sulfurtransferase [Patescibacteria group bacterium]
MTYEVLLFYLYTPLDDTQELATRVRGLCEKLHLKGRIIIATEGINATVEGLKEHTDEFVTEFMSDPRFANINIKRSAGTGKTFPKLSVKVRDEIVGTRLPKDRINPAVKTAPHLSPEELHTWYENKKDFVVVDMRNSYEIDSGRFAGSVDPGLRNSRDLPEAVEKLAPLKNKTVVTVCTGGVRCEKMSAYLLDQGFGEVYQLENGIHSYMEKYPGQNFLGTLYTFDGRVTMDFGGPRTVIGTCKLCGTSTERYINCGNLSCPHHFIACEGCAPHDRAAGCSSICQTQMQMQSS